MDRSKRFFGPCVRLVDDSREVELLGGDFATILLLFDTYILDSCRLLEFSQLVSQFGFEQVRDLLKTSAIKIKCNATQTVIHGNNDTVLKKGKDFIYQFSILHDARPPDKSHPTNISRCLQDLRQRADLPHKQFEKLQELIVDNLDHDSDAPLNFNSPELKALRSLLSDLTKNVPNIKRVVLLELKQRYGVEESAYQDFFINLHQESGDTIFAETNITEKLRIDDRQSYDIIKRACLRLASINDQLASMERYTAVCSLNDQDFPVFDDKLSFLTQEYQPEAQIEQFRRILTIKDFPDFDNLAQEKRLYLDKILEIRETQECKAFREWLKEINTATDKEIIEQINNFRNAIGSYLASTEGKLLRCAVAIGTSIFVSGLAGIGAGAALTLIDAFVLQELFPNRGPISFINYSLPLAMDLNFKNCHRELPL